uniref:Uncharacterized protein n=1 Tax=Clastoptera arizonana TaxID=38151 RepID=A0A1B6CR63_9HEMI
MCLVRVFLIILIIYVVHSLKEDLNRRKYGIDDMNIWDENIVRFYENPCENMTDVLIADLEYYTVGLLLMVRFIELGEDDVMKKAIDLKESGGPKFLQINMNSTELREKSNWDDYNTRLYERSKEDAEDAWSRFTAAIKKADFIKRFDKMNS